MGRAGNVAAADAAFRAALAESAVAVDPGANYFPTVGEQAALLEQADFRVDSMRWFERPTPLAEGQTLVDWLRHFRAAAWAAIPAVRTRPVADRVRTEGARRGLMAGGVWHIDYGRLRFSATAVGRATQPSHQLLGP